MKKYIGTKQVKAEPMVLGKFIEEHERNPYANSPLEHFYDEDGYEVEYEDGYVSWSPADVFNAAYVPYETEVDRLSLLLSDAQKISKELSMLKSSEYYKTMSGHAQILVDKQLSVLADYMAIVQARIKEI